MLSKTQQTKKAPKQKENKMSKAELKAYREFLIAKGTCQICGGYELDIPHHVGIGVKRSDYEQILLCIHCHRKTHNPRYDWYISPELEVMKEIAKQNWIDYNEK